MSSGAGSSSRQPLSQLVPGPLQGPGAPGGAPPLKKRRGVSWVLGLLAEPTVRSLATMGGWVQGNALDCNWKTHKLKDSRKRYPGEQSHQVHHTVTRAEAPDNWSLQVPTGGDALHCGQRPGAATPAPLAARCRSGSGTDASGPATPKPRRRALPSTLVRVRTGLLQALSGATRAECFFMVSRPPAGAQPPIAYILGPGGAPLQARGLLLALASGSPGLQPAPVAATHCGGLPAAHILLAAQHSTHARTASYSWLAANSNVTYKCTPHAHPVGSPAPPPPRDARPCSPRSLPRSQRCPDCGLMPPPPSPRALSPGQRI
ncbi:hypothetical protein NN561_015284 [Cricetulus griseus]